jgi:hypothetical protein
VYSSCFFIAVSPTSEYSFFMMESTMGCTTRFARRIAGRPVRTVLKMAALVPWIAWRNI